MAFNPFNVFRRNQKILFAGLTVFIMFMFTLSFGQGDIFTWLPQWLGNQRGTGEVMAVIDGNKVHESELYVVQRNRVLANQYMADAGYRAAGSLQKFISDGQARASTDTKQVLNQAAQAVQVLGLIGQRQRLTPELLAQFEPILRLNETVGRLSQVAARAEKPEDKELAAAALRMVELLLHLGVAPQGMYFVNQPNRTNKDLIDFILWRKKADQLGIKFTTADTEQLIKAEFNNRLSLEDWKEVENNLGRKQGYSPDTLRQALADEFRVRLAQAAVMGQGYARPFTAARGYDAPYDYYQFYKQQLSTARFGLIPVPAQNFLAQVQSQPSEKEIRELFDKHRKAEPNPASPNPGLTEPRRIKVAWLEATGSEPYYKDLAAKVFPAAGTMPAELQAVAGGVSAPAETLLQREYAAYRAQVAAEADRNRHTLPSAFAPPSLVEGSLVRPGNLGVAAAALAGSLLTGGSWAGPALVFEQAAVTADLQDRAKGLAALLSPPLAVGDRLGAFAAFAATTPKPLPLEAVRGQLIDQVRGELAYQIANDDLRMFSDDLAKLAKDAAAAQAFADKFVKDRGLKTGGTTEAKDQYTVGDDPALAPLKAKLADPHRGIDEAAATFGRRFFFDTDRTSGREVPAVGPFKPRSYPTPDLTGPTKFDSAVLAWRTAEVPAETPKDPNAPGVRDKVVAAWKLMKAKELAKAAAEKLAKDADGLGGGSPAELSQKFVDLREKFKNTFADDAAKGRIVDFEIDDVAPLVAGRSLMPGRQPVGAFAVTPTKEIPYPSLEMADALVAARDKPLGTAVVLADAPRDTYYVAVQLGRDERDEGRFAREVYAASFFSEIAPAVAQRHQKTLADRARADAVALLKAEFGYEKENPKVNDAASSGD